MDMLRVLRVARILRITRLLHLMPEFQTLVVSIMSSLKSLTWVFLLVIITTSVFGVILTQIVTDHKTALGREEVENSHQEVLEEYFGSVGMAMLRLYMTISDGMHWAELADPMMEFCSPWTSLIFVVYSAFVTFAMMNVVTAFFVETALRVAQEDYQMNMTRQLLDLFQKADTSHDETITSDEFMSHLDEPFMLDYLQKLQLSPDQVKDSHFFQLLDTNNDGIVDPSELMSGCVRLMGPAKAVDLAGLAFDFRQEQSINAKHRAQVRSMLRSISAEVKRSKGSKGERFSM